LKQKFQVERKEGWIFRADFVLMGALVRRVLNLVK